MKTNCYTLEQYQQHKNANKVFVKSLLLVIGSSVLLPIMEALANASTSMATIIPPTF